MPQIYAHAQQEVLQCPGHFTQYRREWSQIESLPFFLEMWHVNKRLT